MLRRFARLLTWPVDNLVFLIKKTFLFSDTKSGFPKGIWKRSFQKRYEQTVTYAMSPSVVLGLCKTLLNQSILWFWIHLHKAIVGNRYPHEPQDFRRPTLCVCHSMPWNLFSALAAFHLLRSIETCVSQIAFTTRSNHYFWFEPASFIPSRVY